MRHAIVALLLVLGSCKPAAEPAPSAAPPSASGAAAATAPTTAATVPSEVVLHARNATIHGKTVRYEPEPHKNTIGYWTDATEWVSWEVDVPAPGSYAVHILQGCGAGSGGAEVEVAAAGQTLPFTVEDTGHFQNFVDREIGSLRFDKPGKHTLTVKPKTKPGVAVMDLRQVTLKPAQS